MRGALPQGDGLHKAAGVREQAAQVVLVGRAGVEPALVRSHGRQAGGRDHCLWCRSDPNSVSNPVLITNHAQAKRHALWSHLLLLIPVLLLLVFLPTVYYY